MITTWTTLLITGLRGNGKTLKAVGMMDRFIKAGTPVFACNFNALTLPGVQFLEDARDWLSLPPGSVLFVDEAQRYWRSRRSGEPPPDVIAMETQRHDAVRIVMLTQQPSFLDKHVRGLVDAHEHMIRRSGLQLSQVYTWERCKEDPEGSTTQDLAEKSIYNFESEYFGTYKSADEHNITRKIPKRLKLIAAATVVVLGIFWWAMHNIGGKDETAPITESRPAASAPAAAPGRSRDDRFQYRTAMDYVAAMTPRIEAMPWTAPAFDGREVKSDPRVWCVVAGPGLDANAVQQPKSCSCKTEQGTTYAMRFEQCEAVATIGEAYNPFREPERERLQQTADRGAGASPALTGPAGAAVAATGAGSEADQQADYGGFRSGG